MSKRAMGGMVSAAFDRVFIGTEATEARMAGFKPVKRGGCLYLLFLWLSHDELSLQS